MNHKIFTKKDLDVLMLPMIAGIIAIIIISISIYSIKNPEFKITGGEECFDYIILDNYEEANKVYEEAINFFDKYDADGLNESKNEALRLSKEFKRLSHCRNIEVDEIEYAPYFSCTDNKTYKDKVEIVKDTNGKSKYCIIEYNLKSKEDLSIDWLNENAECIERCNNHGCADEINSVEFECSRYKYKDYEVKVI